MSRPHRTFKNPSKAVAQSASQCASAEPSEFQFERPDWDLFRSIDTLAQKAGVPIHRLRRLVLKELADNALDSGAANVTAGHLGGSRYFVEDDGPGLPGSPDEIARLFSINRPLLSSKLWRLPTRGALGNGLRVVAGAVAASEGSLEVWTQGRHLVLTPRHDGGTDVLAVDASGRVGTRIEITFGPALPEDRYALLWAEQAILLAGNGETYQGKPSPHWSDLDHWRSLLRSAGRRPVRDLIANLDGCTGAKASTIAAPYRGRACDSLTPAEAADLLSVARKAAKPVRPERLGRLGPIAKASFPRNHAFELGRFRRGQTSPAEIPFIVEAWADVRPSSSELADLTVAVNRTPITGEVQLYRRTKNWEIWGCNLYHELEFPRGSYRIWINITSPFVPITTDGKEPDLEPFANAIAAAITKAARRARRELPAERENSQTRKSQKQVILESLPIAIEKTSGGGQFRFSQRQLFYSVRPMLIDVLGQPPSWDNFQKVITEYESAEGDLGGMYRDPRGTLYTPHTGEEISVGTLSVEKYERPPWTFNKILHVEKEGFFEVLKAARWPERHDCALLTSKGYATRALRDLLDSFADSEEPLMVFCVHDADAFGSGIYQALQEETKARPGRRVRVINLGLDPWEALAMGLPVEPKDNDRKAPVARYVLEREDGQIWAEWLQTKRVELNAMSSPQFISWLDAKMLEHKGEKVIPPGEFIRTALQDRLEQTIRDELTVRILRDARIDEQVAQELESLNLLSAHDLQAQIASALSATPHIQWRDHLDEIVKGLLS